MRRHISMLAVVAFVALVSGCGTDKSAFAANQGELKPSPEFVKAVRDFADGDKTAFERMKKHARTLNERKLVFLKQPTVVTAQSLLELATSGNVEEILDIWVEACEPNRYDRPIDNAVTMAFYRKFVEIAEAADTAPTWRAAGTVAFGLGGNAYSYVVMRQKLLAQK